MNAKQNIRIIMNDPAQPPDSTSRNPAASFSPIQCFSNQLPETYGTTLITTANCATQDERQVRK